MPTAEDEFTNPERKQQGPHRALAKAIAQLIVPDEAAKEEKTDGVSVGLEGSWGSGKTTVIHLLREELKGDGKVALISFDAWAHEGDPLRRTFLETIIRHLQDEPLKWLDGGEWARRIDELARRREVVETRDTPLLSNLGKVALATPLLVPLGAVIFGQALRESEEVPFALGGDPVWRIIAEFCVGGLLALAPLLLLTFKAGRDAWATILTKGILERRTEINNRTANPTSIEFEKNFDDLMKEALCRDESRRIVLVLDNLDRVDSKDALAIWSTLQTFLQHRHDERKPWYRRLWILVLYDPQALKLLWEKKAGEPAPPAAPESQGDGAAGGASAPPAAPPAADSGEVAASFIDKSFQIRFEVPPPVLSNWREFLIEKCLGRAFPDHRAADLYRVYRVMFIDRAAAGRRAPTIRELKLFVNQIGALHRQLAPQGLCGGAGGFPLPLLAYYVVLRRRDIDIAEWVLRNRLPEPGFEGLLGDNAGDKLAALYYNVEVSLARQIILDQPIKVALQETGEREKLLEYAQNPRAFWVALERIIEDNKEWETAGPAGIARAAYSLNQPALLKSEQPDVQRQIEIVLGKFAERAKAVRAWPSLSPDLADGLVALLDLVGEKEFAGDLLTALAEMAGRVRGESPVSEINVQRWAGMLAGVFKRVTEFGDPQMFRKSLIRPLTNGLRGEWPLPDALLEVVIEALCELEKTSPDFPELGHSASQELSELIESGAVSRQLADLSKRPPSLIAWAAFAILREHLSTNNLGQSRLPHPAAAAFLRSLGEHFAAPPEGGEGEQAMTEQFADQFLAALARYSEENLLFDMLRVGEAEAVPLITNCLLRAVEGDRLRLDPRQVLQHWAALREGFGAADFVKFVSKLSEQTDLLRLVRGDGFDTTQAHIYEDLYVANAGNEEVHDWFLKGLRGLADGDRQWAEQLRTNGGLLNLAALVAAARQGTDGVVNEEQYARALADYAGEICKGAQPAALRTDLPAVLAEGGPARRRLREALFEMLCSRAGDAPAAFGKMFAAEIINPDVIVEYQGDVPQLLRGLLRNKHDWWLNAVAETFRTHPQTLPDRLDPGVVEKLGDVLSDARRGGDARRAVVSLSKALNFHSPDDIARDYEALLRDWVHRARETTMDVKAELEKMKNSGDPFIPPYSPYSLLERTRGSLTNLGAVKVKVSDEGVLRAKLIKVLDEVIGELERDEFVPRSDAKTPAGNAKGADADYDVQP